MRILIVNRALGILFGGGEAFDVNMAEQLRARGHTVTMLTGVPLFTGRRRSLPEATIAIRTPTLRFAAYALQKRVPRLGALLYYADLLLFQLLAFRWLRRKGRCQGFDVVQCCSLFALATWLQRDGLLPVACWFPGPPSRKVLREIPARVHEGGFGVFTHGSPMWDLERMGLGPERDFAVIEPGVDIGLVDRHSRNGRPARSGAAATGARELSGITVARLVPVKNLEMLIRGIALARLSGARWRWLIVGEGSERRSLERCARREAMGDVIRFVGQRAPEEVHALMSAADCMALTSSYENYSLAVLEAMAHGLPIIGTDVGFLGQLIRQAGAGVTVRPGDARAFAAALLELQDDGTRSRFGSSGREFAERHSWPRLAGKLESFLTRLAGAADCR